MLKQVLRENRGGSATLSGRESKAQEEADWLTVGWIRGRGGTEELDFSQWEEEAAELQGDNLNKSSQAGGVWPLRELRGRSSDCGVR